MNNENLEKILKIRNIRKNLTNENISLEVKEILRKSLNYLEDELDLEIAKNNNNILEFENEGIEHSNVYTEIPLDKDNNRYQEYTSLQNVDILKTIETIIQDINDLKFQEEDNKIILKSLKEYLTYLRQLEITKANGKDLYNDILSNKK